jgi:hypothetical protein
MDNRLSRIADRARAEKHVAPVKVPAAPVRDLAREWGESFFRGDSEWR